MNLFSPDKCHTPKGKHEVFNFLLLGANFLQWLRHADGGMQNQESYAASTVLHGVKL